MSKFFTKRSAPPPDRVRRDVPPEARSRVLATFQGYCDESNGGIAELLSDVGEVLFKAYGHLCQPAYEATRISDNPVIQHFFSCRDEYALDFIEACFQQWTYNGKQEGVEAINEVFREHGLAYELTPYVEHHVVREEPGRFGTRKQTYIETDYPRFIRIDSQLAQQEIVGPALHLLSDPRLRVANGEMLGAYSALRAGECGNAITLACSSFESFLKTICDLKQWQYDPQRDTCSRLVAICCDAGLFPTFYTAVFQSVGTVRNRIGSAHGRGPVQACDANLDNAQHIVRTVSAHMLFLAKQAGMS